MAAFLNLVHLVTGMGESNSVTSSPGRLFTKWMFVDTDENEDENKGNGEETDRIKGASASCLKKTEKAEEKGEDEGGIDDKIACPIIQTQTQAALNDREANGNAVTSTAKRSKNQKKKDRKKTRNRSNSTLSTDSVNSVNNKTVTWGVVEEILFSRDQGLGTVPSSGLFALGFGVEEGRQEFSVAQHVSHSQVRLIERAQQLGLSLSSSNSSTCTDSLREVEAAYKVLETRQFDYRSGKNPLFHSSTEDER